MFASKALDIRKQNLMVLRHSRKSNFCQKLSLCTLTSVRKGNQILGGTMQNFSFAWGLQTAPIYHVQSHWPYRYKYKKKVFPKIWKSNFGVCQKKLHQFQCSIFKVNFLKKWSIWLLWLFHKARACIFKTGMNKILGFSPNSPSL